MSVKQKIYVGCGNIHEGSIDRVALRYDVGLFNLNDATVAPYIYDHRLSS